MKIALRVFALICLLWALFAAVVPGRPPPLLEFWWTGAIKDADEILAHSGDPNVIGGTNAVSVSRASLGLLTRRAKEPEIRQSRERMFRWSSVGFALVAGISLFVSSRR